MMDEDEAERIRASRGDHKVEASCTGEAGLHQSYVTCDKNPVHKNFIPVKDFNIEHLPSRYRDKLLVDYVRAQSDLTCCLSVSRISEDRPDTWPKRPGEQPLLLPADKEKNCMNTGTGWVSHVIIYSEWEISQCECEKCLRPSNTPEKARGEIFIKTARHVVYDNEEARHTKCQFFYDSPETDINKVLTLTGFQVRSSYSKEDWCEMRHTTHDVELLDRFDKMFSRWAELSMKVYSSHGSYKYVAGSVPDVACDTNVGPDLCIVVSHPHGCDKIVTVGALYNVLEDTTERFSIPTCPGCSGAPIITLSKYHLTDDFQVQISYTGEAGRLEDFVSCKKNPGHKNFIPVKDFNISHLPSHYRDNLVVDCVLAISDITCRLLMSRISGDRPDTLPDSDRPYPFSALKETNCTVKGTGWVDHVIKYTEEEGKSCPCNECLKTGTLKPKKTWGKVCIRTANHVIYDSEEARHTKCQFFYDSPETDINKVPTLTDLVVWASDIKEDSCRMYYVTHDMKLLGRLYKKWRLCEGLRNKVYNYYRFNISSGRLRQLRSSSDLRNRMFSRHHAKIPGVARDKNEEHNLCIIVSHPHGFPKVVTVGAVTHVGATYIRGYKERISYSYNTPTCSGSSGALVFMPNWFCYVEHSQGGQNNNNKSVLVPQVERGMESYNAPGRNFSMEVKPRVIGSFN